MKIRFDRDKGQFRLEDGRIPSSAEFSEAYVGRFVSVFENDKDSLTVHGRLSYIGRQEGMHLATTLSSKTKGIDHAEAKIDNATDENITKAMENMLYWFNLL
jgi:hypothetical protein